ncbi:HNH endonuclease [Streptomyces atratus]|uniref:HNH endonuclease n=1 Tax=Streptomyces atratus TaxID=1893 RepID=UPI0019AA56C0|nr:HNH endonuclease [Streptomyces atratus]WPW31409.1 HNH endonuclease [Streptomyces atratus]GGT06925.1 hypothetical protein GCM10010207_01440 [Streptomyces atratus]
MKTGDCGPLPGAGDEQAGNPDGGRSTGEAREIQWVLQPRGTARVRGPQHFNHSVRVGVDLSESTYESALGADAEELRRIFPDGLARLWGATPDMRAKSAKVTALRDCRIGDELLFYADKQFVARARILGLFRNRPLAQAIWGADDSQRTWEHIMALGDVAEFNVPAEPVLRGLGLGPSLRSLTLVRAEDRLRFLDVLENLESPGQGEAAAPVAEELTPAPKKLRRDDLFRALATLNTHSQKQRPSRHKPLTLLWAVGRLAEGRDRVVDWETFKNEMGPLLKDFGLPDSRITPEYPFWHLRSSGLWDVEGVGSEEFKPTSAALGAAGARAGLTRDAARILRKSLARAEAVGLLCSKYFEDVDRDALLGRVGLAGYASASGHNPDGERGGPVARRDVTSSRPERNREIVETLKTMYTHECQVCGKRVATQFSYYSEAAHIRGIGDPHGGPDELSNLLSLCPNHHVEFDRLAIYIDETWAVRRNSDGAVEYQLKRHADHVINEDHVRYHRGLCGRL